ncbi:calcium load-activated calcium channel-like [Sarcophilus harrisii]
MSTMFADTLLIVFISVCTALLAEGITWVLVYRTDKYKRLKAEVEKQSKKLEKKKETITESAGRQQKKKIERQEEKLKNNNRDLSMVRMKSMFAIGFCFTALMGMFNSIFDGRVVAVLILPNDSRNLPKTPQMEARVSQHGYPGQVSQTYNNELSRTVLGPSVWQQWNPFSHNPCSEPSTILSQLLKCVPQPLLVQTRLESKPPGAQH